MPTPPSEPDMARLRGALKSAREAAGLTLEELAEKSGVSRQTLLNLGSGSPMLPHTEIRR